MHQRISRRTFMAGMAAATVATALPSSLARARSGNPLPGRHPKYVILIDWDGFDPSFLDLVPTPNVDALIARGSISIARSTYTTYSNSARASMSTGAYPEVHGNAAYYYDVEADRAVSQTRFLTAETIMEALGSAGKTVASVQWYMVQNHGVTYGDPEHLYVQPGGPFERRVNAAIDILNLRPVNSGGQMVTVPKIPDFLAVYGSDIDGLVHGEGTESPNIGPLMTYMDQQLGRLVQAVKDVGIYGETAFLLTGDHGMSTWNRSIARDVLAAITSAGYQPEIVSAGRSADPDTEVIIVQGVRVASFALRGGAATPEGQARVRSAVAGVEHVSHVFDKVDLSSLHASEKLGDFVAEAEAPWDFSLLDDGKDRGSHGSTEEIHVPLVLSGAGILRDSPPQAPGLTDVSPTISELLRVRPPRDAQGRALSESLGP